MINGITGAELKRFYKDPEAWPPGRYEDDIVFTVDGVRHEDGLDASKLEDHAIISIEGGYVEERSGERIADYEPFFLDWRRRQNSVHLVVTCAFQDLDRVRDAIEAAGGTVNT